MARIESQKGLTLEYKNKKKGISSISYPSSVKSGQLAISLNRQLKRQMIFDPETIL